MAEVKSTLELVMERTRHLTMTEEDKREQALAEFKSGLSGLLQKVQDEVLSPERFKADLRALQESLQVGGAAPLILEELAARLELEADNSWVLALLTDAFGVNTEELAALFREYRQTLESLTQTRSSELSRSLSECHGIQGSAVVPNWAADPGWAAECGRLRERFKLAVSQAVAKLKVPEIL